MPELPTCTCVRGLPPYDRLTAIYQAAAELSGSPELPDSLCVAGVPPFQRFSFIYEAFRDLAGGGSLPSQVCVNGESPQDQVSRIYQAVALYADDASLKSYECVRGMPIWQQWIEIYRALYLAAGSPEGLVNPACVSIANLDVLSDVFCALTMQVTATLLASFYIPEIVDSFERSMAAGYSGNNDPDTFQREAAVDVLRDAHYQEGLSPDGDFVILEDDPTECILVAPDNLSVTPGVEQFDAEWDDIPVTISLLRYEWRLDNTGGWTSNGTSTTISGESATAGDHVLSVRAISTSGAEGAEVTSDLFEVLPSSAAWYDSMDPGDTDSFDTFAHVGTLQPMIAPASGPCTKLRLWAAFVNTPTTDLKMALYDSSRNLIEEGLVTDIGALGSDVWIEVTLGSPVNVTSSTTYGVGFCTDTDGGITCRFLSGQPSGTSYLDFGINFASFPPDPFSNSPNAWLIPVGMLIG